VARPRRARARGAWRLPLRRAAFFVSTPARRFSGRRGGAVEDPALSPRGVHHLVLSGDFSCRLEGPTMDWIPPMRCGGVTVATCL
jgi:hypothetical protein